MASEVQAQILSNERNSKFRAKFQDPQQRQGAIVPVGAPTFANSLPTFGRRRQFPPATSSIVYDSLRDPALEDFFARGPVRKHLMKNGWFSSNAICTMCCNRGGHSAVKICQVCQSFYHLHCLPPMPLTISGVHALILHASKNGGRVANHLRSALVAIGNFSHVDELDARMFRPMPDLLDRYHAVLVVSNGAKWTEPEGLGDLLSDYVHVGRGGVVLIAPNHKEAPGGRWRKHRLSPLLPGRNRYEPGLHMGQIEQSSHPLIASMEGFGENGVNAQYVLGAVSESGGSIVARWSNGQPLAIVLDDHPTVERGRVVALNFSLSVPNKSKENSEEAPRLPPGQIELISNALRFVAEPTYHKSSGEFTCDPCRHKIQVGRTPSPRKHVHHHHHGHSSPNGRSLYHYTSHLADPAGPPRSIPNNVSLDQLRTQVLSELQVLKELYRQKFKEQIAWSANRKYAVGNQSRQQRINDHGLNNHAEAPSEKQSERLPPIAAGEGEGTIVSGGSRPSSRKAVHRAPASHGHSDGAVTLPEIPHPTTNVTSVQKKPTKKVQHKGHSTTHEAEQKPIPQPPPTIRKADQPQRKTVSKKQAEAPNRDQLREESNPEQVEQNSMAAHQPKPPQNPPSKAHSNKAQKRAGSGGSPKKEERSGVHQVGEEVNKVDPNQEEATDLPAHEQKSKRDNNQDLAGKNNQKVEEADRAFPANFVMPWTEWPYMIAGEHLAVHVRGLTLDMERPWIDWLQPEQYSLGIGPPRQVEKQVFSSEQWQAEYSKVYTPPSQSASFDEIGGRPWLEWPDNSQHRQNDGGAEEGPRPWLDTILKREAEMEKNFKTEDENLERRDEDRPWTWRKQDDQYSVCAHHQWTPEAPTLSSEKWEQVYSQGWVAPAQSEPIVDSVAGAPWNEWSTQENSIPAPLSESDSDRPWLNWPAEEHAPSTNDSRSVANHSQSESSGLSDRPWLESLKDENEADVVTEPSNPNAPWLSWKLPEQYTVSSWSAGQTEKPALRSEEWEMIYAQPFEPKSPADDDDFKPWLDWPTDVVSDSSSSESGHDHVESNDDGSRNSEDRTEDRPWLEYMKNDEIDDKIILEPSNPDAPWLSWKQPDQYSVGSWSAEQTEQQILSNAEWELIYATPFVLKESIEQVDDLRPWLEWPTHSLENDNADDKPWLQWPEHEEPVIESNASHDDEPWIDWPKREVQYCINEKALHYEVPELSPTQWEEIYSKPFEPIETPFNPDDLRPWIEWRALDENNGGELPSGGAETQNPDAPWVDWVGVSA
ncbi:hypothetical protein BJ742DRAFT_888604 [Cladochytrium replicatum]|nr:hypothetical protein BJ742DRAFT_888604 [Cladochytrium replicatum]